MKISKQIILPLAIIVILVVYLVVNSAGKMNYKIPAFNSIDDREFGTIEIEGLSNTIKLYSDNEIWRFSSDNLRVDPSKIAKMVLFLSDPVFIDMVSDTDNYQNYGLDREKLITVRVWTNNKRENPDRELFIGNLNTTGSFTFIRRPDNISVFTVRGNIRNVFDITEDGLIDKRVLNIDISEIDKIVLTSFDSGYSIEKTVGSEDEDIWTSSKGPAIDINKLEQNLRYLSNSRFNSYIDSTETAGSVSLFKIDLLGKNMNESFVILEKTDEGYYCESSFAGKRFILSENSGTQIVKMFSELMEIEED